MQRILTHISLLFAREELVCDEHPQLSFLLIIDIVKIKLNTNNYTLVRFGFFSDSWISMRFLSIVLSRRCSNANRSMYALDSGTISRTCSRVQ